jgi:hypothetical protein
MEKPSVKQTVAAVAAGHAVNAVQVVLAAARLGAPLHHRNLTVFPIHLDDTPDPAYDLLRDALDRGDVEVGELAGTGSVPRVSLVNHGARPVLVPEGEIITGAKQNRVVNLTVLIAARSTYVLPVSCVERGRWHAVSTRFSSGRHAHPELRAAKIASVNASRRSGHGSVSDQGRVWDDVDRAAAALRVDSATSSLTDVLDGAGERVEAFRAAIALPPDACGFVAGSGANVVGLDLFGAPSVMARVAASLADAYFTQASWDGRVRRATKEVEARAFLDRVASGLHPSAEQTSAGVELEVDAPGLTGTALAFDGALCHLAAFAVSGN